MGSVQQQAYDVGFLIGAVLCVCVMVGVAWAVGSWLGRLGR